MHHSVGGVLVLFCKLSPGSVIVDVGGSSHSDDPNHAENGHMRRVDEQCQSEHHKEYEEQLRRYQKEDKEDEDCPEYYDRRNVARKLGQRIWIRQTHVSTNVTSSNITIPRSVLVIVHATGE
jgi:hypothetical protein